MTETYFRKWQRELREMTPTHWRILAQLDAGTLEWGAAVGACWSVLVDHGYVWPHLFEITQKGKDALNARKEVTPDEPRIAELEAVRQRLDALTSLRGGWDGGRSGPVSVECARFASTLIEHLRAIGVQTPQIVPLSGGDLQLEWSQNNLEVEVRITKKLEDTP
jgi:hypothetical protein